MKLFDIGHVFPFGWETITKAYWRKYPNELASHVVSVDVLDRSVDSAGNLRSTRLVCVNQPVPSILKKIGVNLSSTAYFLESSVVDPKARRFTAQTENLTFTNVCQTIENCVFTPGEYDPSIQSYTTNYSQNGHVSAVKTLSYLGRLVEEAAVNRFYANASAGRAALEQVVHKVHMEGAKGLGDLMIHSRPVISNTAASTDFDLDFEPDNTFDQGSFSFLR